MDRLERQLQFIYEIDKVKSIIRRTRRFHEDKLENDAEHSWHICIMALILQEYADDDIDIMRIIKMLLIHDLVEIDVGDVIVYNKTDAHAEAEDIAARRIFGLLPESQVDEYYGLWREFEDQMTSDARFAMALDRMEPIMQSLFRGGEDWRRNGISYEKVIDTNKKVAYGSKALWDYIKQKVDECNDDGGFGNG
jgi:putative hydrolase of HD superfamily